MFDRQVAFSAIDSLFLLIVLGRFCLNGAQAGGGDGRPRQREHSLQPHIKLMLLSHLARAETGYQQ